MEPEHLQELWPLGEVGTMPADAWQVKPHEPLGVGLPPQERPEQVPRDACRKSAPRLLEASHLAPHHFPTPARRPIAGSESLGRASRPALECADLMEGGRSRHPRLSYTLASTCGYRHCPGMRLCSDSVCTRFRLHPMTSPSADELAGISCETSDSNSKRTFRGVRGARGRQVEARDNHDVRTSGRRPG